MVVNISFVNDLYTADDMIRYFKMNLKKKDDVKWKILFLRS